MRPSQGMLPALLLLALLGCPAAQAAAPWENHASWSVVEDETGRRVRIPARPRRIVTLTPSLAEVVCALGLEDSLAGVSQWSDFPPAAALKPQVGSYVSPNLEAVLTLGADLALASRDGNPPWAVERLQRAGVPVYVTWPRHPLELAASLENLGAVCGRPDKGRQLAQELRRDMDSLRAALEGVAPPSALLVIGNRPLVCVGPETFSGRLLTLAGGRNLAPADGPAWPRLPLDFVVKSRPQVVILSTMGGGRDLQAELAWWRTLPGLAGQPGYRVERVSSDLIDRPGPRLGLGLRALAAALHPDIFPALESRP